MATEKELIFWLVFTPMLSMILSILLWRYTIINESGLKGWLKSLGLSLICTFIALLYSIFKFSDDLEIYRRAAEMVIEQYS